MDLQHQPGEIIAQRYRILGTLGQGGVGITYAALDLQNERRVALKTLSLRRLSDWKAIELFEREARILAQLNHPAIPRYLDYFQVDTQSDRLFYIVQQLAEGQPLATLIEKGWQPNEAQVRQLATQVLKILLYLHSLTPPVIHRDIKPQNLILQKNGRLFLVDFGAVQDTYHNTMTGSTAIGTYGYMAPEQFRGKAVPATDLYGLGTTILFLLTGQSPADLPQRQLKIDFRSQVHISKELADWLEKMIEPAIEDRLPSAKVALAVLQGEQALPQSSISIGQPKDSPIRLKKTNNTLTIEIPPVGLRSKTSQVFALINLVWNGLLALVVWMLVALSLFLQPSNLLVFGIYTLIGLWILNQWLYKSFSYTKIEISSTTFHLNKVLLGSSYQKVSKQRSQINRVGIKRGKFGSACLIQSQWKPYQFGEFLTPLEQKWLIEEIEFFLGQNS